MKHLKLYESFQEKITISLLELCEYTDGMYNAIDFLKNLAKNCSDYVIKYEGDFISEYKNAPFDKKTTDTPYAITNKERESIVINSSKGEKTSLSYGYMSYMNKYQKNSLYFTFYNVEMDDSYLTFLTAKKYNL